MTDKSKISISFRVDSGVVEHNNRTFSAKNVDAARTCDNVIYKSENLQELYHQLFDKALTEYNSKKRSNERITDYYEHIQNGKQEKLFYEAVVQFGDIESCGLKSDNWKTARQMLDEYMQSFEQRNPNIKVFNAVLHLDEATPHLHIDFVPICTNQSRGLSTRVSLKRALAEQGITAQSRKKSEWAIWKDKEFEYMTELLRKHGYERDVKNDNHQHLTVEEYKEVAVTQQKIRDINAQINELKKKSDADLSPDEITLIKNQNDFLRSQIIGYRDQNAALSQKASADFAPIEIYDDDKLQFVAAELTKRGIKFVEENTTLYVPEYAREQALAISESYCKEKPIDIRERVKLDIDRLVYCSHNTEELLEWLKQRGYEVKSGKYIAAKPPFGERFVRLKTLGAAYLPKNLEIRIAERDNFTNAIKAKFETANDLEKPFHITVMNTIIAVKEFRLIPKKTDNSKIYIFKNDANINHLAQQLETIGEFHFTSREDMCAKAEELQAVDTDEAKLQLKRVRKVIQMYDKIICSDYIGELIKAQQAKQSSQSKSKQQNHHKH